MSYIFDAIRDGNIMHFKSTRILTCAIFGLVLLWFGVNVSNRTTQPSAPAQVPETSTTDQVDEQDGTRLGQIMGHGGITNLVDPNIQAARISISVSESDMPKLPLMQPLRIKLPGLSDIMLQDDPNGLKLNPSSIAKTTVEFPNIVSTPANASEFIFGVATTYERLESSLDVMSHWASGTDTKIIGHMQPSLDSKVPDRVLRKAQSMSIPLGIVESGLDFLDRYFTMLKVLYAERTPQTKWYVFIDDDTMFLSLSKLIETFQKYDPDLPWYIGALTEDFNQLAQWGYMAYGGGGVFLSQSLVEQLIPNYDKCFAIRNTGDRMLAGCIYKFSTVKLTWEHNLHQLDLHRDQSGFYEALRPQPLSIHHWKSDGFHSFVDVRNMTKVASVCGDSCILQKFRFADNWVLTNGYSLVKYSSEDMKYRDLNTDISMEETWDFWGGTGPQHFEHSLGPLRVVDEGKISYRLESALTEDDGKRVRQLYVKRKRFDPENNQFGEVDAVIEVEWIRT